MKKVLKTLAIILLIFAIVLASLVVWQWGNIKVLLTSVRYATETIDTMVAENKEHINQVLNELTDVNMRELNDEEREKLLSGELSEEEAVKVIMNMPEGQQQSDDKVDDIISRIYLLRAEYISRLSTLEKDARAKGKAALKQKISISERLSLIETYTGKAAALEKECDARMKSLIKELENELKRLGKDTGIVSDVREYYEVEKKLKKSQLLSKYSKYLK